MRHCFVPFAVIGLTSLAFSCHLIRGPASPQPLKVMTFNIRKIFFLFNTHFDHIGETARLESARLLLKAIQSLAASAPVIVTGDFNATETSMVYQILTGGAARENQSHALRDARHVSFLPSYGASWSFHGFGKAVERPLIDYVFVNNPVKVLRHGIISEPDPDRYACDHLAVLAEVILE
jgi:endonuclease/exonuclease/phosphatase family metal-dependent hydrolase